MNHTNQNVGTAIVTGASSGIGAEFARALAARGFDLVLVARREERLNELAHTLTDTHKVRCETLRADLACDADLRRVEARISDGGDIAMLVNNAGFGIRGYFADTSADEQERMIRVHCTAPMRLTRAALPAMIARDAGAIVNVASIAGFAPAPGNVNYHATKAYLIGLTEALHLELAGTGVYLQALCPGFTYSEFHDVIQSDRRAVEKKWWMNPDAVVEESLREALKRKPVNANAGESPGDERETFNDAQKPGPLDGLPYGRVIVVPGARYRRLLNIVHILPRPWLWKLSELRSSRIGKRRKGLGSR